MSKRRYDHLRVRKNTERRVNSAIKHPEWDPEETGESIFGPTNLALKRILDEQFARGQSRPCSNGNCSIFWDPKTRTTLYSIGPAGCCDE